MDQSLLPDSNSEVKYACINETEVSVDVFGHITLRHTSDVPTNSHENI